MAFKIVGMEHKDQIFSNIAFSDGEAQTRYGEPARRDWSFFLLCLRDRLNLTSAAFCATYRLQSEEIAQIEIGAGEPDWATGAYLEMIDKTPELIARLWIALAEKS